MQNHSNPNESHVTTNNSASTRCAHGIGGPHQHGKGFCRGPRAASPVWQRAAAALTREARDRGASLTVEASRLDDSGEPILVFKDERGEIIDAVCADTPRALWRFGRMWTRTKAHDDTHTGYTDEF